MSLPKTIWLLFQRFTVAVQALISHEDIVNDVLAQFDQNAKVLIDDRLPILQDRSVTWLLSVQDFMLIPSEGFRALQSMQVRLKL